MLKIEHLTKSYGEKKAVDDLSLHIEKGMDLLVIMERERQQH